MSRERPADRHSVPARTGIGYRLQIRGQTLYSMSALLRTGMSTDVIVGNSWGRCRRIFPLRTFFFLLCTAEPCRSAHSFRCFWSSGRRAVMGGRGELAASRPVSKYMSPHASSPCREFTVLHGRSDGRACRMLFVQPGSLLKRGSETFAEKAGCARGEMCQNCDNRFLT